MQQAAGRCRYVNFLPMPNLIKDLKSTAQLLFPVDNQLESTVFKLSSGYTLQTLHNAKN